MLFIYIVTRGIYFVLINSPSRRAKVEFDIEIGLSDDGQCLPEKNTYTHAKNHKGKNVKRCDILGIFEGSMSSLFMHSKYSIFGVLQISDGKRDPLRHVQVNLPGSSANNVTKLRLKVTKNV